MMKSTKFTTILIVTITSITGQITVFRTPPRSVKWPLAQLVNRPRTKLKRFDPLFVVTAVTHSGGKSVVRRKVCVRSRFLNMRECMVSTKDPTRAPGDRPVIVVSALLKGTLVVSNIDSRWASSVNLQVDGPPQWSPRRSRSLPIVSILMGAYRPLCSRRCIRCVELFLSKFPRILLRLLSVPQRQVGTVVDTSRQLKKGPN